MIRGRTQEITCQELANGCRLRVVAGDLTALSLDAIVNAANSGLRGGGGIDGAIHRAGGPTILAECQAVVARDGPLPTGRAVATGAGNLPARWVIHTVGPVYKATPQDAALLAACYRSSLEVALELGCRSVGFPGISTGVYGYPVSQAAPVAVATIRQFLLERNAPQEVVLCTFDAPSTECYRNLVR